MRRVPIVAAGLIMGVILTGCAGTPVELLTPQDTSGDTSLGPVLTVPDVTTERAGDQGAPVTLAPGDLTAHNRAARQQVADQPTLTAFAALEALFTVDTTTDVGPIAPGWNEAWSIQGYEYRPTWGWAGLGGWESMTAHALVLTPTGFADATEAGAPPGDRTHAFRTIEVTVSVEPGAGAGFEVLVVLNVELHATSAGWRIAHAQELI